VRTGGLRVSMRFMGPEEGGVVAVSRTSGPSLLGIFAARASPPEVASPSKGESKGAVGGGYSGTHKGGVGLPQGPLLIWSSLDFYIFACTYKLLSPCLP
jgi:hypothetical protein